MSTSIRPDPFVSTDWVAHHFVDPEVTVIEVDADPAAYAAGHVPGALLWVWPDWLSQVTGRGEIDVERLEALLGGSGVDNYTTLVLYGDGNNVFASAAFGLLQTFGHPDVRLMQGGRDRWIEEGHPLTTAWPRPVQKAYRLNNRPGRQTGDQQIEPRP